MTDPETGSFEAHFDAAYEEALRALEERHRNASSRWQKFQRWRARRLLRRRLYDRSIIR